MNIKELCHQLCTDCCESVNGALLELMSRTRNISDVSELCECDGFTVLLNLMKKHDGKFILPVLSVFANCANVIYIRGIPLV